MEQYKITLDCYDGFFERTRKMVSKRMSQEPEEIQKLVRVEYTSSPLVNYGVNPLVDMDTRAFADFLTPSGESLMPPTDVAFKLKSSNPL